MRCDGQGPGNQGPIPHPPSKDRGPYLPAPDHTSLIDGLELARLLTIDGAIVYRAVGSCMLPAIRPADLLAVELRDPAHVKVGEVALVRRKGRLVGHRVIAAGTVDGEHFIVTRSDRARTGDGRIFASDLLGIVVGITRKGRALQAPPMPPAGPVWRHRCLLAWLVLKGAPGRSLRRAHSWLAASHMYGVVARRLLRDRLTHASLQVHLPLVGACFPAIGRRIAVGACAPADLVGAECFSLELWTDAPPPAAYVLVTRQPVQDGACWHVAELVVRQRYRGCGLEDRVLAALNALLGDALQRLALP
jgi:hypothetical protein